MGAIMLGCILNLLLSLLVILVSATNWSNDPSPSIHLFLECLSKTSSTPIKIYTQNTTTYTDIYQSSFQNPRVFDISSSRTPLLIIVPSQEAQVQASVVCGRRYSLQLRVRSGGHDFEGLSYVSDHTKFVMLDLANFTSINVNLADNTAWVQAGVILEDLYDTIAQQDATKSFPAGLCPKVGVGGQFSGGGMGPLIRIYGLAADNILDARIVDSNGRLLDRRSMGEDLFWAIRGGGAASYGVVLSYKVNLVYVPPKVTIFSKVKTLEEGAAELIGKWQEFAGTTDRKLYMYIIFQAAGFSANRTARAIFEAIYQGPTTDLLQLMDEAFPELGVTRQDCREVTYSQALQINAASSPIISDQIKPPFKAKSDFVRSSFPKTALQGLSNILKENVMGVLIMESLGGKMDEISETQIPFPHRKGNMTPYVSKSPRAAYLNYRDLDLGRTNKKSSYLEARSSWGSKYFKGNFRRLALVKAETDRTNFFRNEQSIPPLF